MTKRGSCYTPGKTREFERTLKMLATKAYQDKPLEIALKIDIWCFLKRPPTVKRKFPSVKPDGDNFIKSICDSLNGILWRDDAQLVDINFQKRYSKFGTGSITLLVNKMEETDG